MYLIFAGTNFPINIALSARIGPVPGRCGQQRARADPVLALKAMFMGLALLTYWMTGQVVIFFFLVNKLNARFKSSARHSHEKSSGPKFIFGPVTWKKLLAQMTFYWPTFFYLNYSDSRG